MKATVLRITTLWALACTFDPAAAQQNNRPILLKCENVRNENTYDLKIHGKMIWFDGRIQKSKWSETTVRFIDDDLPGFEKVLDRTNGKLTVYNNYDHSKWIDSVYNCKVVKKVIF